MFPFFWYVVVKQNDGSCILTGYLKAVVEEAKIQGVKFISAQISVLDEIIDRLSEIADMQNMDELSKADEQSIYDFAKKYKDIVPDEFLEDSIDLD